MLSVVSVCHSVCLWEGTSPCDHWWPVQICSLEDPPDMFKFIYLGKRTVGLPLKGLLVVTAAKLTNRTVCIHTDNPFDRPSFVTTGSSIGWLYSEYSHSQKANAKAKSFLILAAIQCKKHIEFAEKAYCGSNVAFAFEFKFRMMENIRLKYDKIWDILLRSLKNVRVV